MFTSLAEQTGVSEKCAERMMDKAIEIAHKDGTIGRWSKWKLNRSRKLRAKLSDEINLQGVGMNVLSGEVAIMLHEAAIVIAEEEKTAVDKVLEGLTKILNWIIDHQDEILQVIKFIAMLVAMI